MTKYHVVYHRERAGWFVEIPSVHGCHTQGRTIEQARRHMREALSLCVDEAAAATFSEEIQIPARMRQIVERAREARARAEESQERAKQSTEAAVVALTKEHGFSLRDAGELLGLSRQRAHQLAARGKTPRKA